MDIIKKINSFFIISWENVTSIRGYDVRRHPKITKNKGCRNSIASLMEEVTSSERIETINAVV